jgi:hypothetical protein
LIFKVPFIIPGIDILKIAMRQEITKSPLCDKRRYQVHIFAAPILGSLKPEIVKVIVIDYPFHMKGDFAEVPYPSQFYPIDISSGSIANPQHLSLMGITMPDMVMNIPCVKVSDAFPDRLT